MSQFYSRFTQLPVTIRPLRRMFCAALLSLLSACSLWNTTPTEPPPSIPEAEAIALANRHAANMKTVSAPRCEIIWKDAVGSMAKGSQLEGSLVCSRGGKIRIHAYQVHDEKPITGTLEPTVRMISDGTRFWIELNSFEGGQPPTVFQGPVAPRHPRTSAMFPIRPHDIAAAICFEPVPEADFEHVVTVVDDTVVAEVRNDSDSENEAVQLVQVQLYYSVILVETPARVPLRKIWIERESKRIHKQVYYDTKGKPQVKIHYYPPWVTVEEQPVPTSFEVFIGDGKATHRFSFLFGLDSKIVTRNAKADKTEFDYTPPKDAVIKRVDE